MHAWTRDRDRGSKCAAECPTPHTHTHSLPQVNFWRSLEEALRKVEGELRAPGVRVTVNVLKQSRRIIAVAALENNTGLDQATKVRLSPLTPCQHLIERQRVAQSNDSKGAQSGLTGLVDPNLTLTLTSTLTLTLTSALILTRILLLPPFCPCSSHHRWSLTC
jgi:hypothetical protein